MKKVFAIMLAAMFAFAMTACGDKDSNKDNNSGNTPQNNEGGEHAIASTYWVYEGNTGDGSSYVGVRFSSNHSTGVVEEKDVWVRKMLMDASDNVTLTNDWIGKFSYNGTATSGNGSMTMHLENDAEQETTATFSISGDRLTLNLQGENYTLTQPNN